jgi:putative DNA primase/helicase
MSGAIDYNDLAAIGGLAVVRQQLAKPVPASPSSASAVPAEAEGPGPLAPPTMRPEGFPPLIRAIVDAGTASSEAHPAAIAANVIAWFGAAVGRVPYQRIGDQKIHGRPFFLIVGKSAKARKGTSETTPREVARRADAALRRRSGTKNMLRFHKGGVSTTEGIIKELRDPIEGDDKGKGADPGVVDKRLAVIEPEFEALMAAMAREGNTLAGAIRTMWDGDPLAPLRQSSPYRVEYPHVTLTCHCTAFALRTKVAANDIANGVMNRFILVHVHRPKLVPLPEPTPDAVLDDLAQRLAAAIDYATKGDPHQRDKHEVVMTPGACDLWCELYPAITRDRDGKVGSLMARSEVYCRMLSMIFALMDCRSEIEPCDVLASLAWVDYWAASVAYVFHGDDDSESDDDGLDPFTAEVLKLVQGQPGVKLSEVNAHWSRNKTTEVRAALEKLMSLAPPLVRQEVDKTTGGRVAKRYFPSHAPA